MNKLFTILISMLFLSTAVLASDGVVSVKSAHSAGDTAQRLEDALKGKGMKVFARINHAAGAKSVGKTLRPTELVIFGNPKVGAPLMQCSQGAAIDLPQKALVWEDASGQVWLSYNDPQYLVRRHGIKGCEEVLGKIAKALGNFARAATAP